MTDFERGRAMTDRELDALVAEKVMGCRVLHQAASVAGPYCGCLSDGGYKKGPHGDPREFDADLYAYSTDISAAWQVVEKMKSNGYTFELDDRKAGWAASFVAYGQDSKTLGWVKAVAAGVPTEIAEAAPRAICLAALKTVAAAP